MHQVELGTHGLKVSELGFGCMGLTTAYGDKLPDDKIIDILQSVYDRGVTLWDTANIYVYSDPSRTPPLVCQEEIIGRALKQVGRDNVVISTKTGINLKLEPDGMKVAVDGSPAFIRKQCEASLERLEVDCLDILYLHRIDPDTPIEVSMIELKKLIDEGKIKHIGLSECSSATLRRACAVHPVSVIQMEYSVWCRGVEHDLITTCKELGVGVVAYSPLGRGFLTNTSKTEFETGDYRNTQGRMTGEQGKKNAALLKRFEEFAASKDVSTAQLSLAWLKEKGKQLGVTVVAIPGTTKPHHLDSNVQAMDVVLTDDDMKMIEEVLPWEEIEGGRYGSDSSNATWETDKNRELTKEEREELGL